MKNKKAFWIIISVVVLIILLVVVKFFYRDSARVERLLNYHLTVGKGMTVEICKEKDCGRPQRDKYYLLSLDNSNSTLDKVVEDINNDTKKLLEKVKNSDVSASECNKVAKKYNYRYSTTSDYFYHEDKNIIGLGVQRTESDLCLGSTKNDQVEYYVYSKKDKKLINQKEFIELIGDIDDEFIQDIIKSDLKFNNEYLEGKYTIHDHYDDLVVYYDDDYLNVSYFLPDENIYMSSTLSNEDDS